MTEHEEWRAWFLEHLDRSGLTGAELGRRVGRDASTVSNWRRGSDRPRPETVRLIAREFGVDPMDALRVAGYLPSATAVATEEPDAYTLLKRGLALLEHERGTKVLLPSGATSSIMGSVQNASPRSLSYPVMAVTDAADAAAYLLHPDARPEPAERTLIPESKVSDPDNTVLCFRVVGDWLLPHIPNGHIVCVEMTARPRAEQAAVAVQDNRLVLVPPEAINGHRVLGAVASVSYDLHASDIR